MKMSHTLVFVHHSSCLKLPDPSNFLKCGVWFSLLLKAQGLVASRANHVVGLEPSVLPLTGMEGDSLKTPPSTPQRMGLGALLEGTGTVAPAGQEAPSPPTSPVPELYPYRNRRSVTRNRADWTRGRGLGTSHPGWHPGPVSGWVGGYLGILWVGGVRELNSWIYLLVGLANPPLPNTLGSKSQCRC